MKKPDKKEHINLFFSAFLILAFIICANFFANFTATMDSVTGQLINIAVYAAFGLLLFYATRVGDGKAVFRLSIMTLLIMVLPAVLIIIASLAEFMPLHDVFAADKLTGKLSMITSLAAVALGYGVPDSFVSGFELAGGDEAPAPEKGRSVLRGGVEADIYGDDGYADDEEAEEALMQSSGYESEGE